VTVDKSPDHSLSNPAIILALSARMNPVRKSAFTPARGIEIQGSHIHDLRRTAVRNMVRAGVSERVAMSISGHKTRSVFDRYHIVAPRDLREAARKLENNQQQEREALEKSRAPESGQSLGIVAPKLQQNSKILKLNPSMAPLPD
jgi:hypothetical protein